MTILDYPGQAPREADDAEAIANLLRKGWIERPLPPDIGPGEVCAWDGAQWVVSPAPPAPVPAAVESHKCRIELIVRDEWWRVLALVAAMQEPQRSIATEALGAPYYNRDSPMLALVAQGMGWSEVDVDERFVAAASRVV